MDKLHNNSHQRNTSPETWQECGEAESEEKSQLPILALLQCVAQTGASPPPYPEKVKEFFKLSDLSTYHNLMQ